MKLIFICILAALTLSSCTIRDQVVDITYTSPEKNADFFVHKEDAISVVYHFWKDKGMMSMVISNNTDKPIYIDWFKSSLVSDGLKRYYWSDQEIKNTVGTSSSASVSRLFTPYNTASLGVGSFASISIIDRPERKTFIPPHSKVFKSIQGLRMRPFNMTGAIVSKVPRNDKNKKTTEIKTKQFDYSSSPLIFRNYLTWSFLENFETELHVDDEFWVSKVVSMNNKHFKGKTIKGTNNGFDFEMPFESPKRFFIEWAPK